MSWLSAFNPFSFTVPRCTLYSTTSKDQEKLEAIENASCEELIQMMEEEAQNPSAADPFVRKKMYAKAFELRHKFSEYDFEWIIKLLKILLFTLEQILDLIQSRSEKKA